MDYLGFGAVFATTIRSAEPVSIPSKWAAAPIVSGSSMRYAADAADDDYGERPLYFSLCAPP
jgi:hypothetical protein